MNNQRRKILNKIAEGIENLQYELEEVINEERDSFDNMPENLQDSDRGRISEEAIDIMEEAASALEDVINNLSGI